MLDEQDEDFESLNNRLLQELSNVASTLTSTKQIPYIDCIKLKWVIRYRSFFWREQAMQSGALKQETIQLYS